MKEAQKMRFWLFKVMKDIEILYYKNKMNTFERLNMFN